MIFTSEGFFEVVIEGWPEWDLNSRPLNSVQTLYRLSYQAISSTRTQSQLCKAAPISWFVQCQISCRLLPSSVATFILIVYFSFFVQVIT